MAKWECSLCGMTVGAPDVRPVHAVSPNPNFQGRDPRCHEDEHKAKGWFDGVPMVWKPDLAKPEPEKVAKHPGFSLSGELKTSYSINDQPKIRNEVSGVMGIIDKGHPTHGANFSSPQTLKQIIDNLFATLVGTKREEAAEAVKARYGYDPRTMLMAK
jgi:hypothetical protein